MTATFKRFIIVAAVLFGLALYSGKPYPDALDLLSWAGILSLLLKKEDE